MNIDQSLISSLPDASWSAEEGVAAVAALIKLKLQQYLQNHQPGFVDDIHDNLSFDYIGLDSVARVELVAMLENQLGIEIDPTAAYDFFTVGTLACFVWSQLSGTPLDLKTGLGG